MTRAKKSLGQHFLLHARIAERITLVAELTKDSIVLEIGPGTGILTRQLLKKAKKVIAIEADQELYEKLRTDFANEITERRLHLNCGDIRSLDLATIPQGYQVVANIPYYLTGEIFRKFLTADNQPSAMALLVQKEVAERVARSKKESILSLSVKAYGSPEYAFTVKRGAFIPAPRVDSAVLLIKDISRKNFATRAQEEQFFKLIQAAFAHKRKLVRSNLSEKGLDPQNIPEKARAEDLPLSAWLHLISAKSQPSA